MSIKNVVFLLAGVVLLTYLSVHELENRKIKNHGLVAQAEWTGETHKLLFGITSMGFRFKTRSGETVVVSMPPNLTEEQLRSGERVQMRYMETDPRKTARIVGNESGKSYLFWIGGFLMVAIGIHGIRSRR